MGYELDRRSIEELRRLVQRNRSEYLGLRQLLQRTRRFAPGTPVRLYQLQADIASNSTGNGRLITVSGASVTVGPDNVTLYNPLRLRVWNKSYAVVVNTGTDLSIVATDSAYRLACLAKGFWDGIRGATYSADNIEPLDGFYSHTASTTITVRNDYGFWSRDDGPVLVEWREDDAEWHVYQAEYQQAGVSVDESGNAALGLTFQVVYYITIYPIAGWSSLPFTWNPAGSYIETRVRGHYLCYYNFGALALTSSTPQNVEVRIEVDPGTGFVGASGATSGFTFPVSVGANAIGCLHQTHEMVLYSGDKIRITARKLSAASTVSLVSGYNKMGLQLTRSF